MKRRCRDCYKISSSEGWWRFGSLLVGCGALRLVTVVMGLRCRRRRSVSSGLGGGVGVWWNGGYGGEVDRFWWFTVKEKGDGRASGGDKVFFFPLYYLHLNFTISTRLLLFSLKKHTPFKKGYFDNSIKV